MAQTPPPDRRRLGAILLVVSGAAFLESVLRAGLPERGVEPYLEVFGACALEAAAAAAAALRLESPARAPEPAVVASGGLR